MKVSIDTAVLGLLPVPILPDASYGIGEYPRAAGEGATCKSLTRARIRYSRRASARTTVAALSLPRTRWHRWQHRHG